MSSLIVWYADNNKLIIQVLIVIVALTLVYWAYRFFFKMDSESLIIDVDSSEEANSTKSESMKHRLDDDQSRSTDNTDNKLSSSSHPSSLEPAFSVSGEERVVKFDLNKTVQDLPESVSDKSIAINESTDTLKSKVSELEKRLEERVSENSNLAQQIKKLQAKLDEYEIVAEDLTELQQLKAENAKLKEDLNILTDEKTKLGDNESVSSNKKQED